MSGHFGYGDLGGGMGMGGARPDLLPHAAHMGPQPPGHHLLSGLFPPGGATSAAGGAAGRFHTSPFSPPLPGDLHGHFSMATAAAAENERAEQEVARALETLSRTMRPYR